MAEPWTVAQFKELAARHIAPSSQNQAIFPQALNAFFLEAFEHYDGATLEGKAFVDHALGGIAEMFETALGRLPDTAESRKMKRLLSALKGTHFRAEDLFNGFSVINDPESERIKNARAVLTNVVQVLMDILHDVTRSSHRGPAKFAIIGLYFWLLDEITVAQYLARRSYATLAYTHLRSVMEIIDKVELFTKKPDEADIWVSGDERAIWKRLAPPRVRKAGKEYF
jgi:hypothetical protein